MSGSGLEEGDWRNRVIVRNTLGAAQLPSWADRSFQVLHDQVIDEAYPCFFGVQAERRGEMFYAFACRGKEHVLIDVMAKFAELAMQPAYEKNNIAIFFEPDPVPLRHQDYHDRFWRTLQMLHDADTHPHVAEQMDPADPAWEFSYQGVEMFVVCACPSFRKRHSRNLGPGMVLLFQPRSVFIDKITNKVIGRRAREQVRKRLLAWDELGAHPDLGFFGDPGNLEWKQYFLPDDSQPNNGVCPFSSRRKVPAKPASAEINDNDADVATLLRERARRAGDTAALHFFADGEAVAYTLGRPEIERHLLVSSQDEPKPSSDGNFPLTSAQEGLWFSWCMDPDSAAYHVSYAIELEGPLKVVVLRCALDLLVKRHDILRTAFIDIGGVAWQCVDSDAAHAIDWAEHDLQGCTQPMTVVYQLLQDRGNQSFDLGGDGLLRVTLLHLAANHYILQLCAHQIMLDPWSFNLLRRELLEYYEALRDEREPRLPALSMQFGGYAALSRGHLDSPTLERQLGYWREQLGSAAPVLDLPFDRSRPAHRETLAGRLSHVLATPLHAGVRNLAAVHETTPFVVMLSAFALLLQRYSGQSDVRMAVPLLRRDPSSDGTLIGNFLNIAVIRLQVSSADAFSELMDQGKHCLAEAHAEGDLPFARLVHSLRVPRSLASTPLCQVMFSQVPTFLPEVRGELRVRAFDDGVGRAGYDLAMNVAIDRKSCALFLDYSSALLDVSTVRRMLAHYLDLLEQLTQPAVASKVIASLHLGRAGTSAAP